MKITESLRSTVKRVDDCIWEIPPETKPGMLVPARLYASGPLLEQMDDGVFEQVTNVACLPGIVRASLCMPDGHWGYGFPIGGVAAFRADSGVISPGGIGFDINCGMRLIRTGLTEDEVRPRLHELIAALLRHGARRGRGEGLRAPLRLRVQEGDGGRGRLVRGSRLRMARGPGAHRGAGLPARRRSRGGERSGARAGDGAARDAGLR